SAIAFNRVVILGGVQRCVGGRGRVVRKLREEFLDRLVGIEADLRRVRTDECPAENTAGKTRQIVSLERLESADRDLGRSGDLPQRYAAALARRTELAADVTGHSLWALSRGNRRYVRKPFSWCQT